MTCMKYAILLPDGAADEPVPELNGRTPLEVARTPHMDALATRGIIGRQQTCPAGYVPGSDVCTLSVFGYHPDDCYTGRAPLEAAAQRIDLGPDDVVFRCNLTTIQDGVMVDFSAGHIEQDAADAIVATLRQALANDRIALYTGVMYRHLLVFKDRPDLVGVRCQAPHDIPDQPVAKYLPSGAGARDVTTVMDAARDILEAHPVNTQRDARGTRRATDIWLWGQGHRPQLTSFHDRFGVRGACITAVDLIRGIALLAGWDLIDVPGATGYLDTDYAAKGRYAVEALAEYDLVAVHIEAPDEAGHNGDAAAKVEAIERIDAEVVGPVRERLEREVAWRVLIAPDHPTPVGRRIHTAEAPPWLIAGSDIAQGPGARLTETEAASGEFIDPAAGLMARFVKI